MSTGEKGNKLKGVAMLQANTPPGREIFLDAQTLSLYSFSSVGKNKLRRNNFFPNNSVYGGQSLSLPLQREANSPVASQQKERKKSVGPEHLPVFKAPRKDDQWVKHLSRMDDPFLFISLPWCDQQVI